MWDRRRYDAERGDLLSKGRFSQVEMGLVFRKAECYKCGHVGFYKLWVKQVRRNPEILSAEGEAVREDHRELWRSVPRFAEIPCTLKCKGCGEVMGFYTECIF